MGYFKEVDLCQKFYFLRTVFIIKIFGLKNGYLYQVKITLILVTYIVNH